MNLNDVINKLKLPDLNLRLYFTRKRGINYFSYSPSVEVDLQKELIKLIDSYLIKFISYEQINFSPVGYREETIEKCDCEYVDRYTDVINSFLEDSLDREPLDEDIINKLNFYCLEVFYEENQENKSIKFFRRVTKFKKLSSEGFFGFIKNNRFNKIESNLLGIDGNVDIIVFEGEMLILNHISLERIFSLTDQYLEKAQKVINIIRKANRISNFEQFEAECLNDRRLTRILTKMLTEENKLEKCFENFTNVVNVIEIFELEIDIDNSSEIDRIVYENKDQLMDIIRLVRDSYYKSFIKERRGIDDNV